MDKRQRSLLAGIRVLVDLVLVVFAWNLAFYLRFYSELIPVTKGIPSFEKYFRMVVFIAPIWFLVFKYFDLYSGKRFSRVIYEFFKIIEANSIATVIFITFTYFFDEFRYSRVTLAYFWILCIVLFPMGRSLIRKVIRIYRKKGLYLRRAVIVGSGPFAVEIGKCFTQRESYYEISGFVKVNQENQIQPVAESFPQIPLINLEHFSNWLAQNSIHEVVLALEGSSQHLTSSILKAIGEELVEIKIISDLKPFAYFNTSVESFFGMPMINVNESPLHGWNRLVKRLFDVGFTILILGVAFPIMVLIGGLIKIFSPGPILYSQIRMGLDGASFDMYKFRTMIVDSEKETGAVWASKDDQRKTLLGGVLRRTSLDELPQLFNILKGDMSLVGPRPERPIFVEKFKKQIPGYMLRHQVKAGLTGWAQINGWRGDTALDGRIKCDLYYIHNWSLLFDLKILLLTVFKGFINKNAY